VEVKTWGAIKKLFGGQKTIFRGSKILFYLHEVQIAPFVFTSNFCSQSKNVCPLKIYLPHNLFDPLNFLFTPPIVLPPKNTNWLLLIYRVRACLVRAVGHKKSMLLTKHDWTYINKLVSVSY
jgi:hypothetical protein